MMSMDANSFCRFHEASQIICKYRLLWLNLQSIQDSFEYLAIWFDGSS